MILVDANILTGFTRTADRAVGAILMRPDAGVCGVTRAEILHGARNPADAAALAAALDALVQVPTPEAVWDPLAPTWPPSGGPASRSRFRTRCSRPSSPFTTTRRCGRP